LGGDSNIVEVGMFHRGNFGKRKTVLRNFRSRECGGESDLSKIASRKGIHILQGLSLINRDGESTPFGSLQKVSDKLLKMSIAFLIGQQDVGTVFPA
jgi:hypothetical protein